MQDMKDIWNNKRMKSTVGAYSMTKSSQDSLVFLFFIDCPKPKVVEYFFYFKNFILSRNLLSFHLSNFNVVNFVASRIYSTTI